MNVDAANAAGKVYMSAGVFSGWFIEDLPTAYLLWFLAEHKPSEALAAAIRAELDLLSAERFRWLRPSGN
jgi:uncharacterized protein (DUF3820 family)